MFNRIIFLPKKRYIYKQKLKYSNPKIKVVKGHKNKLIIRLLNILNKNISNANLIFLIFIFLFCQINTSKNIELRELNNNNFIIITIYGIGDLSIINETYGSLITSIIINDNEEISENINAVQNFDSTNTNTIKISFDNQLNSINSIFKNLQNITNINLTNLDFSLITDMESSFEGCISLKSVDLSNIDASKVTSMKNMFKDCKLLESVNFSNFKTEKVKSLEQIFFGCETITSIDLSSFETPDLISLSGSFNGCKSLTYVNLDNFQTSKVTHMDFMFKDCNSLPFLNLNNFNTESVQYMNNMFDQCHSFTFLNLSNFKTPSLLKMNSMFYNNKNLLSLDVSNFNTTLVSDMGQVFDSCHSIKSLNLSNFYTPATISIFHMFYGCYQLEFLDMSNFNTERIKNMQNLFINCRSLKSLNLSSFNTFNVETMESMFIACINLEILDISSFDTKSVKSMSNMFKNCNKLKSLDLKHFYTPNLEKMNEIFCACNSLVYLDISNFDTTKIRDMSYVFFYCKALESINIQNFETSLVTNMEHMFNNCNKLTSLNISHFKTELVTNMNYMFNGCSNLSKLDLNNFYTPNLISMTSIFGECKSLISLNIRNFNTTKIKDMSLLFYNCFSLEFIDIQNFDTSFVTNMDRMFSGCYKLSSLNISHFKTEIVQNMNQMFLQCQSLISLDISNFNTPLLETMNNMFYNCSSLTYLDISNLNTSKVKNFQSLFYNCENLTYLNLSNFDTSSVTTMLQMFSYCKKLEYLDLHNFYTPSLQIANHLFDGCESLKWVDISNFNTSKVTNIAALFSHCHSLTSIDITNFNTQSVTEMHYMFNNCHSLKYINLTNFDTSKTINLGHMFDQCHSLISLNLSHFNTSLVTNLDNMFWNCNSLQYLDVSNFNTKKITYLDNLFILTSSLKFLNLSSFEIYDTTTVNNILLSTNPNIILCYNESKMPSHFIAQVSNYENSCLKLCIMNNKKYILDLEMCIDNCYEENNYKFEYQNICYEKCPIKTQLKNDSEYLCEECPYYYNYNGTGCIDTIPDGYYLNSSLDKTINKCPLKCGKCSNESVKYNLCITCNKNNFYYPKLNDSLNDEQFVECYDKNEEQIGYYLDNGDKIYKPCHPKCKTCEEGGNDENNNCLECFDNINYIYNNGNCLIRKVDSTEITNYLTTIIIEKGESSDIKELNNTFNSTNFLNENSSNNKYIFDINLISEEAKNNFSKIYFDIDKETIDLIKINFSLDEEDKIFLVITEKNDSNTATIDFIYEYTLENGTILNMSNIEQDIFIDIYIPITNLQEAKFDLTKYFAEQGYDIYNKNSEFYNDFCTPANLEDNDITLEDRKKDIYPHNLTLCKNNCIYNGVNIEEKRIICSCNLNPDKNTGEDNEFKEKDDGNFFSYLLDNINYRIFNCYKLFFNSGNLKKSYFFYIILAIFIILLIINCIFLFHTLEKFKIFLAREMPANKIANKDDISESKKIIKTENSKIKKIANPIKNQIVSNKKILKFVKNKNKSEKNVFIFAPKDNLVHSAIKTDKSIKMRNISIKKNEKIDLRKDDNESVNFIHLINKEENINELPFTKAIKIDNRNIFRMFYSFIIEKLEILNLFCNENKIRIILVSEYILSLLINFFFNALLYSDDVVSNKYHNNGKLDIIVTLTLSILSNIITSIFCYYIKYSRGIEEKIKVILEIRHNMDYYRNLKRLILYLKIKFICFFISQLIIVSICVYYIVIFGVLYSCSQSSLIVNYCYSRVESIITSFAVTIIILITRKIGLSCSIKELYNTSKYIYSKF